MTILVSINSTCSRCSEWNSSASTSNGPNGNGSWNQSPTSPATALSYGSYASSGGTQSASAGYSSSYGGSAKLQIQKTASTGTIYPDTFAKIGGSFGPLQNASMSFTTASFSGNSGWQPYAILGVSDGMGTSFDLISSSATTAGDMIDSSTKVGVFDFTTNNWYNNYNSYSTPVLMSSLYGMTDSNNVAFGDMAVLAAFASMGDFGGAGNATAYVNSMQLNYATPIPASFGLVGIGSLVLIGGLALRRRMAATL